MEFEPTEGEAACRAWIRDLLQEPEIRAELDRLDQPGETDERALYRLLGARGVLGTAWPAEYGGRDRPYAELAVVATELVLAGVPDTLFVNGIQTVGQLVLAEGSARQRAAILPGLAKGELFACVLYTEPDAGSDLASLGCAATPGPSGFRLNGTKVFNLRSSIADIGLCAARTSADSRYDGITLFLVDMRAPGVRIDTVPSAPDEQFQVVTFEDVLVTADDVVGGPGAGWALLSRALPFERTGLDFAGRARRWYDGMVALAGEPDEDLGRLGARVECAQLLSSRAVNAIDDDVDDVVGSAVAKWYASELAADIARSAWRRRTPDGDHATLAMLERAYVEAPGLRLSGGTSEMMLQTVAAHLADLVLDD